MSFFDTESGTEGYIWFYEQGGVKTADIWMFPWTMNCLPEVIFHAIIPFR